ncbi:MAG: type II toxin-antitoxin system Phd/YefM family antitoxin [Devosia sp.]
MKQMQAREAKAKFAELLQGAERGESVTITRHGKPVARIVPIEQPTADAEREANRKFIEHLMKFPGGIDFDELRDRTPVREIDL